MCALLTPRNQVIWDETGHEDRCLFTGDGGDYYLVFLGHNTNAEGICKQLQLQATTNNQSSANAYNKVQYLREQSITPDESYYEDPAFASSAPAASGGRQSVGDGGGSRYVSEDPVSMGLYASRSSVHDESQVITDESVEKMLSSLREQFAKQNGRLPNLKAAKKGVVRSSR